MTTQLLIYERAMPVNNERHRDWSVRTGTDYAFARHVNSVPLMAAEFPSAAQEYAIVFAGTEEAVMPMIILGARDRENLYLTETGGWQANYVPAFIRRYPFVFSSGDDGETFTLCIDEQYAGCNQEGRGERLFDADGERTQYLASVLEFLQAYEAQFQRTQAFCEKLRQLDLLEPMQAEFVLGVGQLASLAGFMALNRQRLKGLSGEQFADLAQTDDLELVYLHLQSIRNLSAIAQRAAPQALQERPPEPDAEPAPAETESRAANKERTVGKRAPAGEGIH